MKDTASREGSAGEKSGWRPLPIFVSAGSADIVCNFPDFTYLRTFTAKLWAFVGQFTVYAAKIYCIYKIKNQPYFREIRALKILLSSLPLLSYHQIFYTVPPPSRSPRPSSILNLDGTAEGVDHPFFCWPFSLQQYLPARLHVPRGAAVRPPLASQPADRRLPIMVRTPFSLFDTAPILGVRRPSSFLGLPSISTDPSTWINSPTLAPSYPYMNARPRYLRRTTTQSAKAISALETSLSPSKTIEALRVHRWSGVSPLSQCASGSTNVRLF